MIKRYSATQVESAKKQLQGLEANEAPKNLSVERTIRSLRDDIEDALRRGSSIEDIVHALNGSSINIGVTTLKSYLRKRSRRGKITRPRQTSERRAPNLSPE